MSGWIKLHRNLADWEWYDDHNTTRLFIHCIIRANFEDKSWRGIPIKRGSFYTSLDTLSSETGLSNKQIRTSLDKLNRTGEVASLGMARGRMITIAEYESYQQDDRLNGSLGAGSGQAEGRVRAANKNLRTKEVKNITPERFKSPQIKDIFDYFSAKGSSKAEADKFFHFYESKNWMVGKNKMKKWESAASGWITRNGDQPSSTNENRFA